MLRNEELVRAHGTWDPVLDVYEVVDPSNGQTRYFRWARPEVLAESVATGLTALFWAGLVTAFVLGAAQYPESVAGNRQEQLKAALEDSYNVRVLDLPPTWKDDEQLTVTVEQGWDESSYQEPEVVTQECILRPGTTAAELSLKCPDQSGTLQAMPAGGRSAELDRKAKELLNPTPRYQVPSYSTDPYPDEYDDGNSYEPYEEYDPWLDYEPEPMYP